VEISLPVTLAVLGAALLHATWNALVKSSEDKGLDSVAVAAGSGVIALAVVPFLPAPASASYPWLVGSALVHILYFLFLAGAYRWGELSYSYPIMRGGGPLLVAIAGIFVFREVPSLKEGIAILLISAGILAFARGAHDRRATLFAVANAFVIAAYTLIDAQGARASAAPVAYTAWFFVLNGLVITGLALAQHGSKVPAYFRRFWLRSLAGGACAFGAYAIALWAMTRAPVALVAALRETSVIFAAVIAFVIFKEKMTGQRIAATCAVLAGLVALRI
jgi:drug/metabolite transporter (DMT)-like permease